MGNSVYNPALAAQRQLELCREKGYPHFAPKSGRCWRCKRNIYSPIGWKRKQSEAWPYLKVKEVPADSPEADRITGVTVEYAGSRLVTGCPHCNRSYCD